MGVKRQVVDAIAGETLTRRKTQEKENALPWRSATQCNNDDNNDDIGSTAPVACTYTVGWPRIRKASARSRDVTVTRFAWSAQSTQSSKRVTRKRSDASCSASTAAG